MFSDMVLICPDSESMGFDSGAIDPNSESVDFDRSWYIVGPWMLIIAV